VGTWSSTATNYSSGRNFGDKLMLPVPGYRDYSSGSLYNRGCYGVYWSSSQNTSDRAWGLGFDSDLAGTDHYLRRVGFSVRCVVE
jgi:hypothetical protein